MKNHSAHTIQSKDPKGTETFYFLMKKQHRGFVSGAKKNSDTQTLVSHWVMFEI